MSMGIRKQRKNIKSIRDNYAKGELAKEILKGLAVGGLIVASLALPNLPQIFNLLGIKSSRDRFRIKRAIEILERQNLVKIYERGNKQVIEITEGGEKRVLEYNLDDMKIERPKKWDREWHVISFDIPEKYKKARDALVNKLKDMKVYPLQKSVFICPFNFKNEIDFISEVFNVRNFIRYFVVKKIDSKDEKFIKQYYNLK